MVTIYNYIIWEKNFNIQKTDVNYYSINIVYFIECLISINNIYFVN